MFLLRRSRTLQPSVKVLGFRSPLTLTTFTRFMGTTHFDELKKNANSKPHDVAAQRLFLSEANWSDPYLVIQRVESGLFANNESTLEEYLNAILQAKLIDSGHFGASNMLELRSAPNFESTKSALKNTEQIQSMSFLSKITQIPMSMKMQFRLNLDLLFSLLKAITSKFSISSAKPGFINIKDNNFSFDYLNDSSKSKTKQNVIEIAERFKKNGADCPKGVIVDQNSQEFLSKAFAKESGACFLHFKGKPFKRFFSFSRILRLKMQFAEAKRLAPCVLLIDDLEKICYPAKRFTKYHHPITMVHNQLLFEIDRLKPEDRVFVVGSGECEGITEPGRLDQKISFSSDALCTAMLKHFFGAFPVHQDVDLHDFSQRIKGEQYDSYIPNLVKVSKMKCIADGRNLVTTEDLRWAKFNCPKR